MSNTIVRVFSKKFRLFPLFSHQKIGSTLKLHHKIVKLDEMIAHPRPVVLELCAFFDLECFPDYVDHVLGGIFTAPNPTRKGIDWTPDLIEAVEKLKIDFPDYLFGSHLVSLQIKVELLVLLSFLEPIKGIKWLFITKRYLNLTGKHHTRWFFSFFANLNTLYLLQHWNNFHQQSDMNCKDRLYCLRSNCRYLRQKLKSISQISHLHNHTRRSNHHFVTSLSTYTFHGSGLHFRITESTFILDFSSLTFPAKFSRLMDAFDVIFWNQVTVIWWQWTIQHGRILLTMVS